MNTQLAKKTQTTSPPPLPSIVPYALLALFAIGVAFFYSPGFLSPDSRSQLSQAISGQYTDGSPPMMALYWGLWVWWKQGPEPMFLTHQLLLFGSAFLLLRTLRGKNIRWIVPFIPLIPHILFYSGAIWKDVSFAYTFLFSAMVLLSANIHNQKLSFIKSLAIWLLLFYGTGVKYQAIFVLPVMTLWFSITLLKEQSILKKSMTWVVLWVSILVSCHLLQNALVPPKGEDHMWQHVKLYDLAGMSVRLDQDLFPEFVKQAPEYAFDKVKKVYKPDRVDEMMVGCGQEASLRDGKTKEHRDILWNTWFQAVKNHPLEYLSHRFAIWKTMVSRSPMKSLDDLTDTEALPLKVKYVLSVVGLRTLEIIKEVTHFILLRSFFASLFPARDLELA